MKNGILISLALSLLLGCSIPQQVPIMRRTTDQYNGHTRITINDIPTYWCAKGINDYRTLTLGLMAWKDKANSSALYSITANFQRNQEWLFIEKGASFEALYNGSPHAFISFSGSEGARDIGFDGAVSEVAMWEVSRKDLEEMALSPSIQFRIKGKNGQIERCLNDADRGYILKFLYETQNF